MIFMNYSCEKEELSESADSSADNSVSLSKSEGVTGNYLNGKVQLHIPPGVIPETIKLSVSLYQINECQSMADCNWITLMVSIEPDISFDRDIIVSMDYNLQQVNSELTYAFTGTPSVYYWKSQEDFDTQVRRKSLNYTIDQNRIVFSTRSTGLFAIGLNLPD